MLSWTCCVEDDQNVGSDTGSSSRRLWKNLEFWRPGQLYCGAQGGGIFQKTLHLSLWGHAVHSERQTDIQQSAVLMAIALHARLCHVLVEKGRLMIQVIGDPT